MTHTDSLLESSPLSALAQGKKCGQSEDQQGELDNGAQRNTITPYYVKNHSFEMGLVTDLIGTRVACVGLGNAYTQTLGYVIIWVQVDGVQSYDEDQIALVVPDKSKFLEWIPVILGTPTISHIVNIMKEREIDALAMSWVNTRVVHLLSVCRVAATVVDNKTTESANLNGYDEVVFTKNMETTDAFSSCVLLVKAGKAYTGECINVRTQALQTENGSLLPSKMHTLSCEKVARM